LKRAAGAGTGVAAPHGSATATPDERNSGVILPERMAWGLQRFKGRVLLILSGKDLVAKEFVDLCAGSKLWRGLLSNPRIRQRTLEEATHTFSSRAWRDQVVDWTTEWVLEGSACVAAVDGEA
jgi:hypothetical protein